eukprot:307207_1
MMIAVSKIKNTTAAVRRKEKGGTYVTFRSLHGRLLALLAGLLGDGLADGGQDATAGQGHVLEERAEVLVVAHGERHRARRHALRRLLLAEHGLGGQLEQLGGEVLKHGAKVDGAGRADAAGVLSLAEHRADAADREDQTSLGAAAAALLRGDTLLGRGGLLGGGHCL